MNPQPLLTQDLFAQLQGAPIQQISRQLGTDPAQTGNAVAAALPLLLGALGRNSAQPQGAEALFGALQRDHAGGPDLGGLLGAVLGGGGSRQTDGSAILGHILGGGQPRAAQGLGQATGLGSGQAMQLLAVLAPIVMSFLAKRSTGQGLDAGGLGQLLGQERSQVRQQAGGGALDALLDQDGDGDVDAGDLLKLGMGLFGGQR
ncbi:DUF937 domain-containing protein [Pseudoxanthomonas daejeonensis]|uniref:Calcium-binding protein n=1 Tax=Pseudoxanthomonas daejeonensis TaxID=266062 RepID=A0ABQ6Z5V8_9GAMM|nr:DUF937 domain-containing protein [Pseudoxanthomonas daejeonensis]KAF1693859.1 calcium-binding protein [Pseudoxanthomonas daejeonensis]UNK56809.1 DUF937 domain-containing protein [Pseudoxanthomonas daejeonensis]